MKKILSAFFAVCCFSIIAFAQIPTATLVSIVKAEDERRYDATLENLLKNPNEKVRVRTALAAGRIGDERAVTPLVNLLDKDSSVQVRTMAAFALGEIESLQGADAIIKLLADTKNDGSLRARSVEAAGKIAAANAKDEKSKVVGEAILDALDYEDKRRSEPNTEAILFGLTAVLRARPAEGEIVAAKFLTYMNPRIRADAANTLSRLRAKNANEPLRAMLLSDDDGVARANAARALGAAEDKAAFDNLLEAALTDEDSRVRVSAIRSLGSLKDERAADKLLERGNTLLADYKKSKSANPSEKSELLEIATTLGRILLNTNNEVATQLLKSYAVVSKHQSPETEIAYAQIASLRYSEYLKERDVVLNKDWRTVSATAQGIAELAKLDDSEANRQIKAEIVTELNRVLTRILMKKEKNPPLKAVPDLLQVYAAFKTSDLPEVLRKWLGFYDDVFSRATAAELIGNTEPSKENVEALKSSFGNLLLSNLLPDKNYNDAHLAVITALAKQDKEKKEIKFLFPMALQADDYLVRHHTAKIIKEYNLEKDVPDVRTSPVDVVLPPYKAKYTTKLGRILNANADYVRAGSRKSARAILTTEKGSFTIEFVPEDAPLTVDNFIKLAKSGYFNGLAIHRVVPNFVMQDGDPRGDGNGGPGWQIRCEVNLLSYERGAVGMALSGKDTGGSQWFVTHAPQPHLDGGYTVFGRVNEIDMKIVDNLVRGDKILTVKIIEGNTPKSRRN